MVRDTLHSTVDKAALHVVSGLVLVALVTVTTLKHFAVAYSPAWSRVTESGDLGALVATIVFAVGWYLVATGLFHGVERAVAHGRGNAP